MADFDEFNDVGDTDYSVFGEDAETRKAVETIPSDLTVAAQGVFVGGNPSTAMDDFFDVSADLQRGDRSLLNGMLESTRATLSAQTRDLVQKLLLSPDVDQKEAEKLVMGVGELQEGKINSQDMLSGQMLVADAGEENGQEEESRMEESTTVELLNEFKNSKQAIMNSESFGKDDSTIEATGDFLEFLLPFSEGLFTAEVVDKVRNGDKVAATKAMFALGSAKMDLKELYGKLSVEEQTAFNEVLSDMISSSSGIIFTNDNNLMQKDLFSSIVEGNYYGTGSQIVDNIVSVLDLVGLGWSVKSANRALKARRLRRLFKMADDENIDIEDVRRRMMQSRVQPASVINNLKDTNPERAKDLFNSILLAEGDESSRVIGGASRQEIIADSILPQVTTRGGNVENKIHDLDESVRAVANSSGVIELSDDELAALRKTQLSSLDNVEAVHNRREMNSKIDGVSIADASKPIPTDTGGTIFREVYGPSRGGWQRPDLAIQRVLHALRYTGATEDDLVLLQKVGDEYFPTTLKDVEARNTTIKALEEAGEEVPEELKMAKKNFLVQMNFEHKFDPSDITSLESLSVKRNWFDYIPMFNKGKPGSGSVNRWFFDAASMFDPRISLGANVAIDRASAIEVALIKATDSFTKPYKKLPADRQEFIQRTIEKANLNRKNPSKADLLANGATDEEIKLLDEWKKSWDNIYHLENEDLKRSLKNDGYGMYFDEANNTSLVVRPLGPQAATKVTKVYDPARGGEIRHITNDEIEDLYENGGRISALRRTEEFDGEEVEFVLSTEKPDGSYTRAFNNNDAVLNYIDGYYTVRYKDPHFIDRVTLDARGNPVARQAVKTAPNLKAAEAIKDSLNTANTKKKYTYVARENKDLSKGAYDDDYWSIQSSNGRTAQRIRGERLGSIADGGNLEQVVGHVEGPVESLLNSVRSVSRRVSMRDYIDTYKKRFMIQYDPLIKKDRFDNPIMPRTAADLIPGGRQTSKMMADARANLEYINYLDNGYRNSLDNVYKAVMNSMADIIGKVSSKAEEAVRGFTEEVSSPTTAGKMLAFDAYLATNPLRQFVIQSHQGTLLAANFGDYVLSQQLAKDLLAMHALRVLPKGSKKVSSFSKLTGRSESELWKMLDDYKNSGLDDAIDRQNLVERGLDGMVESTRFKKTKAVHKATVGVSRQAGFDAGERINIMSSWLAHRDEALKTKDVLKARDLDEITAKARNYTFNMNFAGDMPYNKNSAALLFQFMQVPHKAMLQVASNRVLSVTERAKLAAYNTLMLPLPAGVALSWFGDFLPEDPEARQLMTEGLESAMFNKLANLMYEGDTSVDFSGLSAIDPEAPYHLIYGIMTGNLMEIAASSPSLQMFLGYNPRMANFIKEAQNVLTAPTDVTDEEFFALAQSFGNISSGVANFSQAYRELFVNEVNNRYNKSGNIVAKNLTTPEMIAKAFGLPTQREGIDRRVKQKLYEESQASMDDVRKEYTWQKNHLANIGLSVDSPEWKTKMAELRANSMFWLVATEKQKQEYFKLVLKDARKGVGGVMDHILRSANYVPTSVSRRAVNSLENKEGVEEFNEALDFIEEQRKLGE